MEFFTILNTYAEQIGGQFTTYDQSRAIIVVPVPNGRYQTVLLTIEESNRTGLQRAIFNSQVCEFNDTINVKFLLEMMSSFDYSRFNLQSNQLSIQASCSLASTSEEEVKSILQEVALLADQYELKFTGKDIH